MWHFTNILADHLGSLADHQWSADHSLRKTGLSKGGSLISWKTKKQPTVALSTCEAEYMSLASAIQECIYLDQLLKDIDTYQYA